MRKVAILIFVLGVLIVVGVRFGKPIWQERQHLATSDASATKGKIVLAYDNWIGYYILCSVEMKKQMRSAGWLLQCEDDKADYAKRMERLDKGEIDFAVATVDSYILNAAPRKFPGAIIAVVDESKGGDAILAWQDVASNLEALKKRNDFKVGFTPNSPSHHLIKATAEHFDVPQLLVTGARRVETDGSSDALQKLSGRKVEVAVLWEPDVSKALSQKGVVKLLGTENTERLIVDILLVGRKFAANNPEAINLLLGTYFRVLKNYRDNPALLEQEVAKETKLSSDAVKAMLKGVQWASLTDNGQKWFGVGGGADAGLITAIEATVKILVASKDFSSNPIPDKDPYRLTYKKPIEDLLLSSASGFMDVGAKSPVPSEDSLKAAFSPLNDAGWASLKPVGALKIEPVVFQTGRGELHLQEKEKIDASVEKLRHYPKFRVLVKGHTALAGDPAENKKLSHERAESVARYLMVTYSIDTNRIKAVGMGSDEPLPLLPGESPNDRAYSYRLPRVELLLMSETY